MIKRFSERYQTILDRYTTERIIFTGIFLVFCLGLILFGGIGVSLGSQLEQRMQTRAKLNDQIAKAEATWLETQKRMIETSDLPEAATFLKDCFISNGLSLEELVITPLSIHDQGYFLQSIMRIRVTGERRKIFQAIESAQNTERYRFIVQEFDINGEKALIQVKILMHQTN